MLQIYIYHNFSQDLYYLVYRKREGRSFVDSISTVSGPWADKEKAAAARDSILRQAEAIVEV